MKDTEEIYIGIVKGNNSFLDFLPLAVFAKNITEARKKYEVMVELIEEDVGHKITLDIVKRLTTQPSNTPESLKEYYISTYTTFYKLARETETFLNKKEVN